MTNDILRVNIMTFLIVINILNHFTVAIYIIHLMQA